MGGGATKSVQLPLLLHPHWHFSLLFSPEKKKKKVGGGTLGQPQHENLEFRPVSPGSHKVNSPCDHSNCFPGMLTKGSDGVLLSSSDWGSMIQGSQCGVPQHRCAGINLGWNPVCWFPWGGFHPQILKKKRVVIPTNDLPCPQNLTCHPYFRVSFCFRWVQDQKAEIKR